ncbi:MAG: dihydroorotate dehydrogenase, partial [Roseiflexaceae bacterium]|nr:dihydroorotate dehydrogenase [Roseiflexaceae bacterium]
MVELAPANPDALTLHTPVMTAAGCFGYGVEYARSVELGHIGAIVTRTTTLRPRRAVPAPRLIETAAGVLCVGPWPNPGIEAVLNRHAPRWASWSTPVILSIGGESVGEYGQIAAALDGVEGLAGVELTLPPDHTRAAAAVVAVRRATLLPI